MEATNKVSNLCPQLLGEENLRLKSQVTELKILTTKIRKAYRPDEEHLGFLPKPKEMPIDDMIDLMAHYREQYLSIVGIIANYPMLDGEELDVTVKRITDHYDRLRARFTAPIICICGSTKFKQTWIAENTRLTLDGNIVLAVGMFGHADGLITTLETNGSRVRLDDLHKRKIDLCDWVWVLDVGGYIGESTRSEIEYAKKLGKPILYLSQEFPGYVESENESSK